ncbi:unnamed protein product [Leptosia nina]|uniref:Uncharacterized protein n=1 Tax=Leptosia nina TaxID=320188 RepID=A0AAV1JZR7_9NEOP
MGMESARRCGVRKSSAGRGLKRSARAVTSVVFHHSKRREMVLLLQRFGEMPTMWGSRARGSVGEGGRVPSVCTHAEPVRSPTPLVRFIYLSLMPHVFV